MSNNLSQPEEIEVVLMEMEKNEMNAALPFADKKHSNKGWRAGWHTGYVSPYRAAFARDDK